MDHARLQRGAVTSEDFNTVADHIVKITNWYVAGPVPREFDVDEVVNMVSDACRLVNGDPGV